MMTTEITVVDGADGLTPDMLRQRPQWRQTDFAYNAHPAYLALLDRDSKRIINKLTNKEQP